jgi:hypothetical protein
MAESFGTRVRGVESVQARLAPITNWQSAPMLPLTQQTQRPPTLPHTQTPPARTLSWRPQWARGVWIHLFAPPSITQPLCSMAGVQPLRSTRPRRCPHQATEGRPLYVVLLRCC